MTINDELNQGQKEYGVGQQRDYFSFQKGDNRLRVLTAGAVLATHFFGKGAKASTCYGVEKGCPFHGVGAPKDNEGKEKKPSIKYTCYVLDVNDTEQKVQLADLPYSVIKQIGDYQANIDYSFDSFPMPYDVTVKYDPESPSPANMYKVIASPKRGDISDEVKGKLQEVMSVLTPEENVKRKKEWQINEHKKQGIWVSDEIAEQRKKEWREKENAKMAEKIATGEIEPADHPIPYPEDEIKPEDIPF